MTNSCRGYEIRRKPAIFSCRAKHLILAYWVLEHNRISTNPLEKSDKVT